MIIIVDTNIFLDLFNRDKRWFEWSKSNLGEAIAHTIAINPVIYAELAAGFKKRENLDQQLEDWPIKKLDLPYEAAFRAGKAYVEYRKRGGTKSAPLPDFFIGAHAELLGHTILTRDPTRYRNYFPKVKLIAPES